MGWLCPYCGAENPISVRRCRACGKIAGAGFRAREMVCAGAEHLLRDGQAAADACMDADPLEIMGKTNRFAQKFVCVTAALLVVIGIWTGVQTTHSSGIDVVFRRLSSVEEAAGERITEQIFTSVEGTRTDSEAAERRWNAVCDSVEEHISSCSLPLVLLDLEAVQERVGKALVSMEELRPRAEAAVEQWDAVWDGEVEQIGNISAPSLSREVETALERVWSRAKDAADVVPMSCWRVFDQMGRLSQGAGEALQPGMIQEKTQEALEALKSLVGWDTE